MRTQGVVDLVAGPRVTERPRPSSRVRWWAVAALPVRVRAGLRRRRPPPELQFLFAPNVAVSAVPRRRRVVAGSSCVVDVEIDNRSEYWISPASTEHPVHVAASLDRPGEAVTEPTRVPLEAAIPPFGRLRQIIELEAPGESGECDLRVTLVQEGYCWLHDLAPEVLVEHRILVGTE